ncbi:MAG: hypothetical protein QG588_790 [Candidatus Poribacteria bacterium]|nr:hypothetical protein [Candidatus Poribacteria bacterium]
MQIRLKTKWKTYVKGDRTIVNDKIGQALVDEGTAIDESNLHKDIENPEKDKMLRTYKRK